MASNNVVLTAFVTVPHLIVTGGKKLIYMVFAYRGLFEGWLNEMIPSKKSILEYLPIRNKNSVN